MECVRIKNSVTYDGKWMSRILKKNGKSFFTMKIPSGICFFSLIVSRSAPAL